MSRWRLWRRPGGRAIAAGCTIALAGTVVVAGGAAPAAAAEAVPVYTVDQEGLTPEEGQALAGAFEIPNALEPAGSFSYVDAARFADVPLETAGQGEDESGRRTVTQVLDPKALREIEAVPPEEALERAGRLVELAGLSEGMTARAEVSHSELTLSDDRGEQMLSHPLDTTVSYRLHLGGMPVTGQGARLRVTFAPDGAVSQLSHALRKVSRAGEVPVIPPDEARAACAALYAEGVQQAEPTLGYHFPELAAERANGEGGVKMIFPQYTCHPLAETGDQASRLVPAVRRAAPAGEVTATRSGDTIEASIEVSGGAEPYSYSWSSSTTALPAGLQGGPEVSYRRQARDEVTSEQVTVEVTDANGLTATASVALPGDGSAQAATAPGGGGFGALTEVGIEQTVDEWQCAQASADGFKAEMAAHGVATQFDWRGHSAWEWDFKDPSLGGGDRYYVDDVDATWYTGHGWSGGFTFKSSVNDTSIVPGDARWGNRDLEWLQLESCQVLRDTSGTYDYFDRWRQAFRGLHILNGFHTNAYCVGGGTGGRFAQYLFPKEFLWWTIRPALRVQQAWAAMAIDKEPSGVVYRSMGLYRMSDGANNMGDYFWGEGPVGPDLSVSSPGMGMWSITGTV